MENQVVVTTSRNDSKELIGISANKPDYGYIRVESSEGVQFAEGGWINNRVKSTLIKGRVVDLETWVKKTGIKVGSLLSGKIVIRESLTPFFDGQEPKRAGQDGEILHKDGQPIYRNTEFTLQFDKQDELITHDNVIKGSIQGRVGISPNMAANDVKMK